MNNKLLTTAILLLLTLFANAQTSPYINTEVKVNWPYLFNDFYDGVLVVGKDSVSMTKMNYHLRAETLHCIDSNGKIARIVFPGIIGIAVNHEIYRFVDGKLMRQLYEEDGNMLMEYIFIDYDRMGNGYSEGLALYARQHEDMYMRANWVNFFNYRNIHMPGEFNENYLELREKKSSGETLPMHTSYYFVIKGKSIHATSKCCNDVLSKASQKLLRDYIKENKLSWKNTDALVKILGYVSSVASLNE